MENVTQSDNLTIGILAHVDAGKTTLSEAMLYLAGSIRKMGRVDDKDAFLDTYELEKERGITIFSKQALFNVGNTTYTLLDTPGHVDFSAEMERTLQVLDYAILVVSGVDIVQGHTLTLWKLIERYGIPTFIFVNKMDRVGAEKDKILKQLQAKLETSIMDFSTMDDELCENVAMCDEELMEKYLETGMVQESDIIRLVAMRKLFPAFFGSALKMDGVDEFLKALSRYTLHKKYPKEFGARVFKMTRDDKKNRLAHMKITGGSIKVKDLICGEKVNQIRIYSGQTFETINEAGAGMVCAVTGINTVKAGDALGIERGKQEPVLEPVLNYRIILPDGCNVNEMLLNLKQLEEEEPELKIEWDEEHKEIHAMLMGEIQIEILRSLIRDRFGVEVSFGVGNIVYKETINNVVEGVGHYEPLRHYAEVHLLMEPLPLGSGLWFSSECGEDRLDKNWQRLILTHLQEKEHRGVLTGSAITDMRITLVSGKAHLKHTEGGDFRQATYRAVRQGLKEAKSVLLEPYYDFRLSIPADMVGRALSDIERMSGSCNPPEIDADEAVLTGRCPVSTMRDYHLKVISYSRGLGRLSCTLSGYDECHNTDEVVEKINYDSEADVENPTGSIFCAHGAGFYVNWNEVKDYMHLESVLEPEIEDETAASDKMMIEQAAKRFAGSAKEEKELEEIFVRTYGGVRNPGNLFHTNVSNYNLREKKSGAKRTVSAGGDKPYVYRPGKKKDEYVIVDGYNIIFAWKELKELAAKNIDSARDKLIDILSNYQAIRDVNIVVVFDAYRVEGHVGEEMTINNLKVIYTAEHQTADACIESMAHQMGRKNDVTVATSDGLEQVTVLAQGCRIMSARELKGDVERYEKQIADKINAEVSDRKYMLDDVSPEVEDYIRKIKNSQ